MKLLNNHIIRFLLPLLLVALVTGIKLCFPNIIGNVTPFLLYPAIIIFAASFCGRMPAIVATIFATLIANYLFLGQSYAFAADISSITECLVFVIECLLMIWMGTAWANANRGLSKQRSHFRSLIEKSSDVITLLDKAGNITYCSPSVFTVLGYTEAEFESMVLRELMYPEEYDWYRQNLQTILGRGNGTSVKLQHRMKQKDGEWTWIESTLTNLTEDVNVGGIVCNFRNMSAEVEAMQQKNAFIGIASHELKTPVTSLKMYAQIIAKKVENTEDRQLKLLASNLERIVDRITRLINDLLDITRLSSNEIKLTKSIFQVNDLLTEVCDQLQITTEKHRLILLTEDLPLLYADEMRIRQVLINFINNAIKYSPDSLEITIRSAAVGTDHIRISVSDMGIGIAEQHRQKIFERFYRISNKGNASTGGIGVGLYISAEIIRAHGGEIGFESELGKGSEFWFVLPIKHEHDDAGTELPAH